MFDVDVVNYFIETFLSWMVACQIFIVCRSNKCVINLCK